MNANLPQPGDSPETAKFKLNSLRQDLNALATSGATGDTDMILEQLRQQGLPLQ
jgi:hypothetical protein